MKKVILILLLLTSIKFNAQILESYIDTTSLKSLGVVGKVASISDFSFKAIDKNGVVTKGQQLENSYSEEEKYRWQESLYFDKSVKEKIGAIHNYNVKGKITRESKYNTSDYTVKDYVYALNSVNQITQIKEASSRVDYDGEINNILFHSKITYHTKDQVKQIDVHRNQEIWKRIITEYTNGNVTTEKVFDYEGNLVEFCNYEYFNGKLLSLKHIKKDFNENREMYIRDEKVKKFNDKGLLIYQSNKFSYEDGDTFADENEYEYDELGRKIKSVLILNNDGHIIDKYFYTEDKLVSIESYEKDNEKPYSITTFIYSEKGITENSLKTKDNTTKRRIYSNKGLLTKIELPSGDVYSYEYTFDNKGNWTKVIEYKNTIPIKMRLRDIKYHL